MKGTMEQSDVTIGLDLGDKRSHVTVLDAGGEVIEQFSLAMTRMAMGKAFAEYVGCRVAMEVGTHSPWVSRQLKERGFQVTTANPRNVRLISESQRKSDPLDSELLARLARVDLALLSPVAHRSEATQKDRALLRAREGLVSGRTKLINQVRGMTKSMGMRVPACSTSVFTKRARAAVGEDLFPGLEALLETIDHFTGQIQTLDRQVIQLSKTRYREAVRALQQVNGVGPITALDFVLTLEDPARFPESRTVGAYLGLCPRQHSSGEQQPQLRITKCGDERLRRHLIQAAHYILGPFGTDCDLRRYGLRLSERGGKNAKKRAVVAVARKLAVLLHYLWTTGVIYDPLINAERAERAERHAA